MAPPEGTSTAAKSRSSPRKAFRPLNVSVASYGPVLFGISVGLQLLMAAFVLWGPKRTPARETLTSLGAALVLYERDIALFGAGLVLLITLPLLFAACMNAAVARRPVEERPRFERFSACYTVFMALASLLGFLFVLSDRLPFVSALNNRRATASWDIVQLFLPMALALVGAAFDLLFHYRDSTSPAETSRPPRARPLVAVAVLLIACLLLFIPKEGCVELAEGAFARESFHHWSYFAMGPAVAFHSGLPLISEAACQYGFGWPLMFALLDPVLPLSFSNAFFISAAYAGVYILGVYLVLNVLLRSVPWAVFGATMAMLLQLFYGMDPGMCMWNWPSSTLMRHPCDVWLFLCMIAHFRTGRLRWVFVMGAVLGAALAFGLDTGVFALLSVAVYLVFRLGAPKPADGPRSPFLKSLAALFSGVITVLIPLLMWSSHFTVFSPSFLQAWFEGVRVQGFSGVGLIPIARNADGALIIFLLMVGTYIFALIRAIARLLARNVTDRDALVACIAAYGLCLLLVFVARSHPYNLFHAMVPWAMVVVCLFSNLEDQLTPFLRRSIVPSMVAAASALVLLANRNYAVYPSVLNAGFDPYFFTAPIDTSFVGREAAADGDFRSIAVKLEVYGGTEQKVLILHPHDTSLYYAARIRPWSRKVSELHTITLDQLQDLAVRIDARKPEIIVIFKAPPGEYTPYPDVIAFVREHVNLHYRVREVIGTYEVLERIPPEVVTSGPLLK